MLKVWVLTWKRFINDYDINRALTTFVDQCVIEWLEVTAWQVALWKCFILATRTWWEQFIVQVTVDANEVVTLWNNKFIYISLDQTKIDDWLLVNNDWSNVATIVVWTSWPANNYIKLATTNWSWVITDMRTVFNWKVNNKLNVVDYQKETPIYITSTWSANAYVLSLNTPISSYSEWQRFSFKANFSNTWSATVNIYDITWVLLWAKTIKKLWWSANLDSWDIQNWQVVEIKYDWTNFQMISPVWQITTPVVWALIKNFTCWESIASWDYVRKWLWLTEVPYVITEATNNAWNYRILPNVVLHWTNITTLKISIYDGWSAWDFTLYTYRASDNFLLATNPITRTWYWTYEYTVTLNLTIAAWTEVYFTLTTSYNNQWPRKPLKISFSTPENESKIYRTTALDKHSDFPLWCANSSWVLDNSIPVTMSWIKTLTSLTENKDYYLSNTPWAISLTPWKYIKKIWESMSTTELNVDTKTAFLDSNVTSYSCTTSYPDTTVYTTSYQVWKKWWHALVQWSIWYNPWYSNSIWVQISSDNTNWTTMFWATWVSSTRDTASWSCIIPSMYYVRAYSQVWASSSYYTTAYLTIQE